jgi:hypothetical protein
MEIQDQHHGDGPEAVDIGSIFWRRLGQWNANPGSLRTADNDYRLPRRLSLAGPRQPAISRRDDSQK